MPAFKFTFFLALLFYGSIVLGATVPSNERPLSFKQWKTQQITDAENNLVRLSNRLHIKKTGYFKILERKTETTEESLIKLASLEVDERKELKRAQDEVAELEEQVRAAMENLQFMRELTMDTYVAAYLPQFKNNEPALTQLSQVMSKEEIIELLRSVLKPDQKI